MKIPEYITVVGGPDVRECLEQTLDELTELGLRVQFFEAADNLPSVQIDDPASAADLQSEVRRELFGKIYAENVADLIQLRERRIFEVGLDQLYFRILQLGWHVRRDHNRDQCALYDAFGLTVSYNADSENLASLRKFVERNELCRDLAIHGDEFTNAGINVSVVSVDRENAYFACILRENDPPLRRNLTRANVDWLIAIARTQYRLERNHSQR